MTDAGLEQIRAAGTGLRERYAPLLATAGPTVPAVNGYTRFYSSGSLEVCFLGLEEFDASVRPCAFFGVSSCQSQALFNHRRMPRRCAR